CAGERLLGYEYTEQGLGRIELTGRIQAPTRCSNPVARSPQLPRPADCDTFPCATPGILPDGRGEQLRRLAASEQSLTIGASEQPPASKTAGHGLRHRVSLPRRTKTSRSPACIDLRNERAHGGVPGVEQAGR